MFAEIVNTPLILFVLLKDFKFLAPSLFEQVIIVQNYCTPTSHMVAQDIAVSFGIHTARPVIVELPATLPVCVYVCVCIVDLAATPPLM